MMWVEKAKAAEPPRSAEDRANMAKNAQKWNLL
jgi:hypothetical protein